MARGFDKNKFLNDITDKVKNAINSELISTEDISTNNTNRLDGFIQYELVKYINTRQDALDVLKVFNYDELRWNAMEKEIGKFYSLKDIALANLWKFLQSAGALDYEFYL